MSKLVFGKSGLVVNVVDIVGNGNGPFDGVWLVDDAAQVSVGDPFDIKDVRVDEINVATFRALFRHENLIRQLIRTIRTNAGLNTAATTNGLPTTANSPDLTLAQARDAFKSLIP